MNNKTNTLIAVSVVLAVACCTLGILWRQSIQRANSGVSAPTFKEGTGTLSWDCPQKLEGAVIALTKVENTTRSTKAIAELRAMENALSNLRNGHATNIQAKNVLRQSRAAIAALNIRPSELDPLLISIDRATDLRNSCGIP